MPFENITYRHSFVLQDFPRRWFPLFHLYDPDIPLFPHQYFHIIPDEFVGGSPNYENRVFGFVEKINPTDKGLETTILSNKDLTLSENVEIREKLLLEITDKLGLNNPLTLGDVSTAFTSRLEDRNAILKSLWQRIVTRYLGGKLPFGRLYDRMFGFIRFVSSFYSPAGRKSELIQTHYFYTKFGEKIEIDKKLPQLVFYLFPTYEELVKGNLELFPKFQSLSNSINEFHSNYCDVRSIGRGLHFSKFNNPYSGSLNTQKLMDCIHELSSDSRYDLIEAFNAFDKGPLRSVIFYQMFSDLKSGRFNPSVMDSQHFELIYKKLKGFYQTPKVLSLYSQQCFGNEAALPIDTWVQTFLHWPLDLKSAGISDDYTIFRYSNTLGKVERLIWIAAQGRKIHSPLCDDALWCIKFDSSRKARGANPLSCGACNKNIRDTCPSYTKIKDFSVVFNSKRWHNQFSVSTSEEDNVTKKQMFVKCMGPSSYGIITDDFTPIDVPESFKHFPIEEHNDSELSVQKFIEKYCIKI